MDYQDFLRRMPKVELHLHLEGSVRPQTLLDLAKKNDVPVPTDDPLHIYEYPKVNFFRMYWLVCQSLAESEDFARVTYESLEDGVKTSNLRYREMFFNPTNHFAFGVSYREMLDGIIEGIRAAELDYGVRCRLIPSINRQETPQIGVEMVNEVLRYRRDEVIGIGLDHPEALGPPEQFVEAYRLAKKGGLHRTAHACEDAPPKNIVSCLEDLECERLDHGYFILDDPAVVERARERGVPFTCIVRTIALYFGWRQHPVKEMLRQGLVVTLSSDDPPLLHTNLGLEYIDTAVVFNYGPEEMRELCLNAVDAAWLDDEDRAKMRRDFGREIDELQAEGIEGLPPENLPYLREPWWRENQTPRTMSAP